MIEDLRKLIEAAVKLGLNVAEIYRSFRNFEQRLCTAIITGKDGDQEVFHLHIIGGGYIPPMVRRD